MKKKCKVVMLPTNKKGSLWLDNFGTGLYKSPTTASGIYYHELYILSDEELKEGDWIYHKLDAYPSLVNTEPQYKDLNSVREYGYKKIIATTDKTLTIDIGIDSWFFPEPSPEFIDVFIREYNKKNIIKEVMVKYEEEPTLDGNYSKYLQLKVDKNNFISITRVKDSWNKEEVEIAIKDCIIYCYDQINPNKINNWIEQNL